MPNSCGDYIVIYMKKLKLQLLKRKCKHTVPLQREQWTANSTDCPTEGDNFYFLVFKRTMAGVGPANLSCNGY